MIIPQHKQAALRQYREFVMRTKPEITEEEQQEMFGRLRASMNNTLAATITVFGEFEDKRITGIVTGLDPRHKLIKLETGKDWELIEFKHVIGVDLDTFID